MIALSPIASSNGNSPIFPSPSSPTSSPSYPLLDISNEDEVVDLIASRATLIRYEELRIDEDYPVYLITISPDPKLLPDCDFITQHKYHTNFLASYLSTCKCGLFCVEYTQMGFPHYHGWYQLDLDPVQSLSRISHIKAINAFANVKICKAKSIELDKWYEKCNGLWYYKKECIDAMLFVPFNPISKDTKETTPWATLSFFSADKTAYVNVEQQQSQRQFYLDFYKNSLDY